MSEWTKQPIKELLDGQWPGEWGSEPDHGLPSVVVYRSTDLDDAGHLLEDGGVYRFIPPIKLNAKKLVVGDILIEASGGAPDRPVGRAAQFAGSRGESAIGANFLRTLRPKKTVCTSFLRWALVALQQQSAIWRYQQQTTGMINLKVNDYLNHLIDTPPLQEQLRIAEILSTMDEAIEQTEALIAKYHQIKAGLMHDLFTRGLTHDGHLRPTCAQAPDLYKDSPIGLIPKEWEVKPLGLLAEIVSGVTLGSKSEINNDVGVPYLRVANVQDGYFDLKEVKNIRVSRLQLEKLQLKFGDVLMNEGGDFDKLGRGSVWQEEIKPCIHQNHVFRVRPRYGELRSHFLAFWSQSEMGKQYFVLSSKQSTNLASINSTQLNRFPVALPSSIEQEGIEVRIVALNGHVDSLGQELAKLCQQKYGLMHDLLTGRVRVNVAEPAST